MGGNALKEYGVVRVDRATYVRISNIAITGLAPICSKLAIPLEIPNKEDYGDVDILVVVKDNYATKLKEYIQETFNPFVIKKNGNVSSFNIENLQIDVITTSEVNFNIYYTFLCWGDLSMIMGRVSRLYDLKYGVHGLEYVIRNDGTNHVIKEIVISKDPRKIFEFLGYNFDKWEEGFKTQEELRDYLFSSHRIHNQFLSSASENTKHRKRDRLRELPMS